MVNCFIEYKEKSTHIVTFMFLMAKIKPTEEFESKKKDSVLCEQLLIKCTQTIGNMGISLSLEHFIYNH